MSGLLDKISGPMDKLFEKYNESFNTGFREVIRRIEKGYGTKKKKDATSVAQFDEDDKTVIQDMEELCSKYLLPVSLDDYAKLHGIDIKDYELRSVDFVCRGFGRVEATTLKSKIKLALKARELGAESVLGIRPPVMYDATYSVVVCYMGFALIPKDKSKAFPREDIEELFEKIEKYFSKESSENKQASLPS